MFVRTFHFPFFTEYPCYYWKEGDSLIEERDIMCFTASSLHCSLPGPRSLFARLAGGGVRCMEQRGEGGGRQQHRDHQSKSVRAGERAPLHADRRFGLLGCACCAPLSQRRCPRPFPRRARCGVTLPQPRLLLPRFLRGGGGGGGANAAVAAASDGRQTSVRP